MERSRLIRISLRNSLLLVMITTVYFALWSRKQRLHSSATLRIERFAVGTSPLNQFCQPIGFEVLSSVANPANFDLPRWFSTAFCIRGSSNYCFIERDLRYADLGFLDDLCFFEGLHVENCEMPEGWIRDLINCKRLFSLVIISSTLKHSDIGNFENLDIRHLGICDIDLPLKSRIQLFSEIPKMKNLQSIHIENCCFTSSELDELKSVCRRFNVDFTEI